MFNEIRNASLSEHNIYLLRHGELVQTGILCGRTDIALSDLGKQQLIDATSTLPRMSHCFSSPLIRCRIFAQEYCQHHELSLQVDTHLQEMDFGDWDGKSYQALWKIQATLDERKITLGDFWQNPWQSQPPNGESMNNFITRVDHFWKNLLQQVSQTQGKKSQPSNTLVFSHGGVIRYLLAKVLDLPIPGISHMTNIDVPYGALIHIQVNVDDKGQAWSKLML
jgi:alpha-ribazole phosphatase